MYHTITKYVVTVANLIGAAYDNHIVENFISKKLQTLLSPASVTNRARRPVFYEFPFRTVTLDCALYINPYFYLLPTTDITLPMAMAFINSLRCFMNQTFTKITQLFELFGTESGTAIMNHFYCSPSIPTSHSMPVKLTAKATTQTLANIAAKLQYKCRSSCTTEPTYKITEPNDDVVDGNHSLSTRIRSTTTQPTTKASISYFDMSQHQLPMYPPNIEITNLQELLPGFTPVLGNMEPSYASNKIAYSENIDWTKAKCDEIISDPLQAWSSYKWTDPQYVRYHTHY